MLENILILIGAEAYNKWAHLLLSNPLVYVAEAGLIAIFLVHIFFAAYLYQTNRAARPVSPSLKAAAEKAARFGSTSMILTGALVLVFLVLHLLTFKFGTVYTVSYNGVEMRDLHKLVVEVFKDPLQFAWYLIAMVPLGVHLSHGFSALFQTMGLASGREPLLKRIGWAFAVLVAAGFFSQPIYAFFFLPGGK